MWKAILQDALWLLTWSRMFRAVEKVFRATPPEVALVTIVDHPGEHRPTHDPVIPAKPGKSWQSLMSSRRKLLSRGRGTSQHRIIIWFLAAPRLGRHTRRPGSTRSLSEDRQTPGR
jgi:hypothetical protein